MHFLAQKTERGRLLAFPFHLALAHAHNSDHVRDSSQRCHPLQSLHIYSCTKKNLAHKWIWSTEGSLCGYTLPLTHWLCRMGKVTAFPQAKSSSPAPHSITPPPAMLHQPQLESWTLTCSRTLWTIWYDLTRHPADQRRTLGFQLINWLEY